MQPVLATAVYRQRLPIMKDSPPLKLHKEDREDTEDTEDTEDAIEAQRVPHLPAR